MTGVPGQSQSLYRKYRPRSFEPTELVGQEHIARTLQNAIALDRVAHAYLFCGPRGTGKTSTARLLAKAVNCLDPDPHNRPCNHCAACDAINTGATVDIIEIDAASNRGVDDIRDLREKVKYAPTQLRTKFYIIDEAHQLTRDAFNAFLKTLEEPPAHVKFVLATTEPDKLPETVASRCQRFDFRRVPLNSMVEHLARICEREGLGFDDEALRLIGQQATGSLRDAEGLIDQLALYESSDGRPYISAESVRRVLGLSRGDRISKLVDALQQRDAGAGLRLIAEATEGGEDIHQLNRQLVAHLRTLLHLRAGGREAGIDETAEQQAAAFSLAELVEAVRAFSTIDAALNRGSYAQLPLELALVDVVLALQLGPSVKAARPVLQEPPAAAAPVRSVERQPAARQEPPRPRLHVVPEATTEPAPPATGDNPGAANRHGNAPRPAPRPPGREAPRPEMVGVDDGAGVTLLAESWGQIRRDVKMANSRIAALLGSVDPVRIDGDRLILVSPYEFHRNKLNDDPARSVVEDVMARYLGGQVRLVCLAPEEVMLASGPGPAPTAPSGIETRTEAPPPAPSDEPAAEDELVKAAKAIFNATELDPE